MGAQRQLGISAGSMSGGLLGTIKQYWHQFQDAPPGKRFQKLYESRQNNRRGSVQKFLLLGVGLLIVIAGIVLMPAPGPGTIVLAFGGVLLAQESIWAARALDFAEVRLRKLAAWALRFWRSASLPVKIVIVLVAFALAAAAAWATYQWFVA